MKKLMSVFVVILLTLTLGAAEKSDKDVNGGAPCVVLTGADSHVSKCEYHRITSLNDWTMLWQKHKGQKDEEKYDLFYNPLGLPVVDFDRYMVIAIFQGTRWNSAGLEAVTVSEDQESIIVRFDDKSYQTVGPDGGAKVCSVYGFFVIPRSSKPVILEENVQRFVVGPAEWKKRITFPKL